MKGYRVFTLNKNTFFTGAFIFIFIAGLKQRQDVWLQFIKHTEQTHILFLFLQADRVSYGKPVNSVTFIDDRTSLKKC